MTNPAAAGNGHPVTIAPYIAGLVAAVVLTAAAFGAVFYGHALPRGTVIAAVAGAACAQIFVHLYFFLHLSFAPAQRWNLITLLFTILIIIIFVGGTIWVMTDLNYRMM